MCRLQQTTLEHLGAVCAWLWALGAASQRHKAGLAAIHHARCEAFPNWGKKVAVTLPRTTGHGTAALGLFPGGAALWAALAEESHMRMPPNECLGHHSGATLLLLRSIPDCCSFSI